MFLLIFGKKQKQNLRFFLYRRSKGGGRGRPTGVWLFEKIIPKYEIENYTKILKIIVI
jgi:hypothetical protein